MNDKVSPIQAAGGKPSGAFEFISTKKDELVGWARGVQPLALGS